jgi:hypothetical protein
MPRIAVVILIYHRNKAMDLTDRVVKHITKKMNGNKIASQEGFLLHGVTWVYCILASCYIP